MPFVRAINLVVMLRTDAAFRTREVRVAYVGGPTLHLGADGAGQAQDAAVRHPVGLDRLFLRSRGH